MRRAGEADITITDVALQAGFSIRTVSRVLNRSPKVNAATRERVEAAILALGFRPSARARGLATGRSFLIGMVHNDRNALVLDSVQRGIVGEASRSGYELVVHPTPEDGDAAADVGDFLQRSRVDGVLVMPPVSGMAGVAALIQAAGVPAVALSAVAIAGFPAVMLSNEQAAAADAARHLLALGHKRIALLSGPEGVASAQQRRQGYLLALAEAGCLPLAEASGDYTFDSGVMAAEALLSSQDGPTAILAANDVMAAAALKVAAMRGISVPRDLSIVGFDGSLLARMLSPALTTVHRPLGDMAARATACLIDMIEGRPFEPQLAARLHLTAGESSGLPPGS